MLYIRSTRLPELIPKSITIYMLISDSACIVDQLTIHSFCHVNMVLVYTENKGSRYNFARPIS